MLSPSKQILLGAWIFSTSLLGVALSVEVIHHRTTDNPTLSRASEAVSAMRAFRSRKETLPSHPREVSLVAVGDLLFSRGVAAAMQRLGMEYPLTATRDILRSGDLTVANLETPIIAGAPVADFSVTFRSDPGVENSIADAGINLVSLANNHTMNMGDEGLEKTIELLNEAGVAFVGAGMDATAARKPVIVERGGMRFAWLGYVDSAFTPAIYEATDTRAGVAFMNTDALREDMEHVRETADADVVIVTLHAGTEYTHSPNTAQVEFAHAAIDAGADLVIGHHPHVLQTVEEYHGKWIFYSLGNFVFDRQAASGTDESVITRLFWTSGAESRAPMRRIELIPVQIVNSQPRIVTDASAAAQILDPLNLSLSQSQAVTWDNEQRTYALRASPVYYTNRDTDASVSSGIEKTFSTDADADGDEEQYVLSRGMLQITEQHSGASWKSDAAWWVDAVQIADVDGDGIVEVAMSVWRSGNFGSSQPVWVVENDLSVKNHFFLFHWEDDVLKPTWHSSNLTVPNCAFVLADVDEDSAAELVVIEGVYTEDASCSGTHVAVWKWNEWGFYNEWRSAEGSFTRLRTEHIDGKNAVLMDAR